MGILILLARIYKHAICIIFGVAPSSEKLGILECHPKKNKILFQTRKKKRFQKIKFKSPHFKLEEKLQPKFKSDIRIFIRCESQNTPPPPPEGHPFPKFPRGNC